MTQSKLQEGVGSDKWKIRKWKRLEENYVEEYKIENEYWKKMTDVTIGHSNNFLDADGPFHVKSNPSSLRGYGNHSHSWLSEHSEIKVDLYSQIAQEELLNFKHRRSLKM